MEPTKSGTTAGCRYLSTHDGSAARLPVVRFVPATRALLRARGHSHAYAEGKTVFHRQSVNNTILQTIEFVEELEDVPFKREIIEPPFGARPVLTPELYLAHDLWRRVHNRFTIANGQRLDLPEIELLHQLE